MSEQTIHEFGSPIDEPGIPRECRLRLMRELDVLAFALEMEHAARVGLLERCTEEIRPYHERARARTDAMRLGVRLAHRVVSGVYSDEAQGRIERTRGFYERCCSTGLLESARTAVRT